MWVFFNKLWVTKRHFCDSYIVQVICSDLQTCFQMGSSINMEKKLSVPFTVPSVPFTVTTLYCVPFTVLILHIKNCKNLSLASSICLCLFNQCLFHEYIKIFWFSRNVFVVCFLSSKGKIEYLAFLSLRRPIHCILL